ncbi:hypothetical protein Hdeb2414_s0020g00566381 [Helianthus debilis subsp. tardiflorus]
MLYRKILILRKLIVECKFTTRGTVLHNGQNSMEFWHAPWEGMVDFITGKTCSARNIRSNLSTNPCLPFMWKFEQH